MFVRSPTLATPPPRAVAHSFVLFTFSLPSLLSSFVMGVRWSALEANSLAHAAHCHGEGCQGYPLLLLYDGHLSRMSGGEEFVGFRCKAFLMGSMSTYVYTQWASTAHCWRTLPTCRSTHMASGSQSHFERARRIGSVYFTNDTGAC